MTFFNKDLAILVPFLALAVLLACTSKNTDDDEAPSYPIPEGMELVWSDEFDYEGAPAPEKWSYSLGANGWGNSELQRYTDASSNSWVENDKLFIKAINSRGEWTSARLKTAEAASWTHGYFEVRAKLAEGSDIASSIWMLPVTDIYGRWPASGEIIIAERAQEIYQAAFTETLGKGGQRKAVNFGEKSKDNDFHTYAVEWTEGFIRWLVDGEETFRLENNRKDSEQWPFDIPFYLILSVSVGGSRAASEGFKSSIKSAVMEIDYARVYQMVE